MIAYLIVGALMVLLAELRHRRRNAERMEWLRDRAAQRGILL